MLIALVIVFVIITALFIGRFERVEREIREIREELETLRTEARG